MPELKPVIRAALFISSPDDCYHFQDAIHRYMILLNSHYFSIAILVMALISSDVRVTPHVHKHQQKSGCDHDALLHLPEF